jgi:hypothetical protein
MGVTVTGLDEALDALGGLEAGLDDLPALASDPVHDAIIGHLRARASQIPRDTGALAKSLTTPRDRAHIYERDGDRLRFGSTLPQAASPHVAPRIPLPSAQEIMQAVGEAVDVMLDDALNGGAP